MILPTRNTKGGGVVRHRSSFAIPLVEDGAAVSSGWDSLKGNGPPPPWHIEDTHEDAASAGLPGSWFPGRSPRAVDHD